MSGHLREWRNLAPDALRIGILQWTIMAATLAWSLHFVSFLEVKEAALWAGVALLWIVNSAVGRDSLPGFRALAPCWVTLAVVVTLGYFLAPVPAFALGEGLRLLPLLLLATLSFDLLHQAEYRARILRAIVCAACCAALLALLQAGGALPAFFPSFAHYDQDMYSVFGNEGLLSGFLAIALAVLPGTIKRPVNVWRRTLAIAVGGTLVATLLLTASRGGLASASAGLCGLVLLRVVSVRTLAVVLAGVALLVTALHVSLGLAPWEKWLDLFSAGDTGGNLRRWIVGASARLAVEHPVFGCGLGNYARAIPIWLGVSAPPDGLGANTLTNYHAHVDLLEWICETGIVGLLGVVWSAARLRVREPAALCGLAVAFFFSLAHPAYYSAPHALAALLLYAMNIHAPSATANPTIHRYLARGLTVMLFVLTVGGWVAFIGTQLYPSFLLRRAEDRHLAGQVASEEYVRVIEAWGFHPEAHESYGIYAYEHGDFALALQQFHQAQRGLDTGRIHQLLAMASAHLDDRAGACHGYTQCAERWPWDDSIQALQREYCGSEEVSGTRHGQEAVDPQEVPR